MLERSEELRLASSMVTPSITQRPPRAAGCGELAHLAEAPGPQKEQKEPGLGPERGRQTGQKQPRWEEAPNDAGIRWREPFFPDEKTQGGFMIFH